jgi:DNA-binding SARP family transcriptional activator
VDNLELRVLGPLEIVDGPRLLQPAAPMQRALLGQLLLTAGRPVSVEEITRRLWPLATPRRPRNAVQLLVLRVRRALGEFGCDGLIESVPGGYRAAVGGHELDAHRFTELVRRADATADPADQRALLADALALWRGPVLGEPPGGWATSTEAAELHALRLAATERLAAADIAAGHPDRAVPLLRERLRQDPGHEPATLLLMRALQAGGQRVEALEAYQEAYRFAVDQLGLEPSAELRALQEQLLRGDGPPSRPGPVEPRPAVLPMRLPGFVGRSALVERVRAAVRAGVETGTAVCGLAGMAGVGKSALALHLAHELRDGFPDGQLYAELGGGTEAPVSTGAVLERFLRLLGVAEVPAGVPARAELFRARTSGRRVLVVLDDVGSAAQLRALLPGSAGSAVLATARTPYTGVDGVRWFGVGLLRPDESAAVLAGRAGDRRVAADPASTAQVVELCAGLPLALRIAGARLAARPTWSMTRLAGLLADPDGRLDQLVADDMAVRASIAGSFRLCTPRQRRALSLIGRLDTPWFSAWEVAGLLGESPDAATEVVEQLVDARLVQVQEAADQAEAVRYRLHELVRLFAREQPLDTDARRPTLVRTAGA